MNNVILTGRICNDLELRFTNNNKAVCEFTLATNRIGSENTDFITCVLFGKQAENLVKYQSKGSMIGVEGSYRVDRYEDKDGNNRYKHYVLVNTVHFLESKKTAVDGTPAENPAENTTESADLYAEFGQQISLNEEITDDMLPF